MKRRPTLFMLIDLCARLRLACEALGADPDQVGPGDVRLEDLAPAQRARLERLGQQDLWALINESNAVATRPRSRSSSPAA